MTGRSPYPGLRSFDRDEAEVFFGRDRCLDGMAQTLQDTRFLAVLGPSGSGKSSLVRSGLFMHLEAGLAPKAGSRWTFLDIRHPRTHPFRELARATLECEREKHDPGKKRRGGSAEKPDETRLEARRRELKTGPLALVRWWRDQPRHPNANLLVLVDQFEELFGYSTPKERDAVEAFIDLLLRTAANDELDIYVVLTMRSEFLGGCALFPGLAEQINRSLSLTPRMTREECRSAITGPAYGEDLTLDPLLVTTLLNDMNSLAQFDEPAAGDEGVDEAQPAAELRQSDLIARRADQLPLMQHLLNWMWNLASARGKPGEPIHLTLDDYLALGGLRGAMSRHAKEVMDSTGERELTSRIFRALTDQPAIATSGSAESSAVRRRRTVAELANETGASEDEVRAVADAFRAEGVSMLTPEPAVPLTSRMDVDITHESLIRQWNDLSGWIREEAESGRAWQELLRDVGEGKPIRGLDLSDRWRWWQSAQPHEGWAARYGGEFASVDEALMANRRAEQRKTFRLRAMTAGLLGVAVISAAVFGTSVVALGNAQRESKRALDTAAEAQTKAAQANRQKYDAVRLAHDANRSAAMAARSLDQARAKLDQARIRQEKATVLAAAATRAAADAARQAREAESARADVEARIRPISQAMFKRFYTNLPVIWEKKPYEAQEALDEDERDIALVEQIDPKSFATVAPDLEKARGDLATYRLATNQMRELAQQAQSSVAKTSDDRVEWQVVRWIQAQTLLARAQRLQGQPREALIALGPATAAPRSAEGAELRLALAEAQYERASTLFDLEQWQDSAAAARGCLQNVHLVEASPQMIDEKRSQIGLLRAYAGFRCQSLLAATEETEEDAAQQLKQAEEVFDAANIATYTADVSVARAEMLVRYFRRPRQGVKQELPAEIVDPIRNFHDYLPLNASASNLGNDVYPLQALLWARAQNELARRFFLNDGTTSSLSLGDVRTIMKDAHELLASLPASGSKIAGLDQTISQTYTMQADNWIALEQFGNPADAVPGAYEAIVRHWGYLRRTATNGQSNETLARINGLRKQAVELVDAGRKQGSALVYESGSELLARLCSAKSDLPPDATCDRLRASVAAAQSDLTNVAPASEAKP